MNWNIFINPFKFIPEKILLLLGIITFISGCYVSFHYEMIFDGIFDAHPYPKILFSEAFTANTVNVVIVCLLLFILGKISNPKTRMIDILNIAFISRIPIYLTVPLSEIPVFKNIINQLLEQVKTTQAPKLETFDIMIVLVFSSILILLFVYSIVLLVKGFRTAANCKKTQQFILLALFIFIAELLSKWIISLM